VEQTIVLTPEPEPEVAVEHAQTSADRPRRLRSRLPRRLTAPQPRTRVPLPVLAAEAAGAPEEPAAGRERERAAGRPASQPMPTPLRPTDDSVLPREWNLWELERLAHGLGGHEASRAEEWVFLLIYLREFADPDGVLPSQFDALVRESFPELVSAAGAQ